MWTTLPKRAPHRQSILHLQCSGSLQRRRRQRTRGRARLRHTRQFFRVMFLAVATQCRCLLLRHHGLQRRPRMHPMTCAPSTSSVFACQALLHPYLHHPRRARMHVAQECQHCHKNSPWCPPRHVRNIRNMVAMNPRAIRRPRMRQPLLWRRIRRCT